MATSVRRLERSPDQLGRTVNNLESLVSVFISHRTAVGHSPATIRHYQPSLNLLRRCFEELGIDQTGATWSIVGA